MNDRTTRRAGFAIDACARIYAAAESLERGEENPREVAQDIQRMAYAGVVSTPPAGGWPFEPSEKIINVTRGMAEVDLAKALRSDVTPTAPLPTRSVIIVQTEPGTVEVMDPADFGFLLDCAEVGLEGAPEFDAQGEPDPAGARADRLWAVLQRLR